MVGGDLSSKNFLREGIHIKVDILPGVKVCEKCLKCGDKSPKKKLLMASVVFIWFNCDVSKKIKINHLI